MNCRLTFIHFLSHLNSDRHTVMSLSKNHDPVTQDNPQTLLWHVLFRNYFLSYFPTCIKCLTTRMNCPFKCTISKQVWQVLLLSVLWNILNHGINLVVKVAIVVRFCLCRVGLQVTVQPRTVACHFIIFLAVMGVVFLPISLGESQIWNHVAHEHSSRGFKCL